MRVGLCVCVWVCVRLFSLLPSTSGHVRLVIEVPLKTRSWDSGRRQSTAAQADGSWPIPTPSCGCVCMYLWQSNPPDSACGWAGSLNSQGPAFSPVSARDPGRRLQRPRKAPCRCPCGCGELLVPPLGTWTPLPGTLGAGERRAVSGPQPLQQDTRTLTGPPSAGLLSPGLVPSWSSALKVKDDACGSGGSPGLMHRTLEPLGVSEGNRGRGRCLPFCHGSLVAQDKLGQSRWPSPWSPVWGAQCAGDKNGRGASGLGGKAVGFFCCWPGTGSPTRPQGVRPSCCIWGP